MSFEQELLQQGRELKSRLIAYEQLPQTESTKESIDRLQCRLEMISLYLHKKYGIFCY